MASAQSIWDTTQQIRGYNPGTSATSAVGSPGLEPGQTLGSGIPTQQVEGLGQGAKAAGFLEGLNPALGGLMNAVNGPQQSMSMGSSSPMPTIQAPDPTAANAAIFGKAKDQVGQETSGALTGLRSALAGRGLLGSGAEATGTTNVITKGQQELGDTTRENAVTNANMGEQNALANLSAATTQRGQDISQNVANRQIQERQLEEQYQQRNIVLQGLMGALSGAVRSY